MRKVFFTVFVTALIIAPLVMFGCKAKTDTDTARMESTETTIPTEEVVVTQAPVTEPVPAQTAVGQEGIPPTAAVPQAQEASGMTTDKLQHNKEIQSALKTAGLYTGNIDGKIGPRTKKAIMEFQRARGLKVDGKVGPKTWAELEKYLNQ